MPEGKSKRGTNMAFNRGHTTAWSSSSGSDDVDGSSSYERQSPDPSLTLHDLDNSDGDHLSSPTDQDEYENGTINPWWRQLPHDELVITGVSGRFPESGNMHEFADNLYNGEDMVTENNRRWEPGFYDLPKRHGKIKVVNKFDAQFFGVSPKQAHMLDPQLRIMLEVTYEAILDAGINPTSIRGTRTGVFVGASGSETMSVTTRDPETVSGYTAPGCFISMFANRISYTFDFKGPSFPVDTACSSSLLALQLAVDAIRQGHCDQAVVAGCSLDLTANSALQFLRFGMLSDDGKSKSFDADGRGYVRSEAIVALFLQKAPDAKRVYANVIHAKSSTDGYKEAGITVPSGIQQALLLEEVYHEAGVNPKRCVYVEAHGTGTKVGDPQEAHAITEVFCKDRDTPLLIGSVKSNMGHAEPASGLCSVAKVLLAMERGVLPPNLHFTEPNPYIPGLLDGRLQVVTKPTEWLRGYVGINSFGFGGANTHVLLKSHEKVEEPQSSENENEQSIPKMLCLASRTEAGVQHLFDQAKEHVGNKHFHSLLAELSNLNPNQALYRGVALMERDAEQTMSVDIKKVPLNTLTMSENMEASRPVWFVYSGMGSQWAGMSQQLMRLEVFKKSVIKCSDALRPIGIDPYSLLMKSHDGEVFKNTMHCMVCITAVQIALTDVLHTIGIIPDGIVGHSTGEMACGYADGCLTRQQTMILAYHRGNTIANSSLPGTGCMAAIGLSWEEAQKRVPQGVVCACHNGTDSVTISGETDKVDEFVGELKKEGVFAKLVDSSGVPFHSPAMQKVKNTMTELMKKVIPNPKTRSTRWISTSVPEEKSEEGLLCSAEYQVNNAMNPVLFFEALQTTPENSVTIEIGPKSLLAAVLRRSLPKCTNIGLLKANAPSELEFLMGSIGKVYQSGVSVQVQQLYDQVSYPVPRGTPMISPHISWDHAQDWMVVTGSSSGGGGGIASSVSFTIDPFAGDSKEKFLLDHVIDGRPLYPFAGYVTLAWKAACKLRGLEPGKTAVTLRDIIVHKPTIMTKAFKLDVVVSPADGRFEVLDNEQLAASGYVQLVDEEDTFQQEDVLDRIEEAKLEEKIVLDPNDIYKELLLRGYEYGPKFRTLNKVWNSSGAADVTWEGNWIAYLDALLQATVFFERDDKLRLPTTLRFLRIDPVLQDECVKVDGDHSYISIFNDRHSKECFAGGVEMSELVSMQAPRRIVHGGRVYLERIDFTIHHDYQCLKNQLAERTRLNAHSRMLKSCIGDAWIRAKNNGVFNKQPDLPLLCEGLDKLTTSKNTQVFDHPTNKLFDSLFCEDSASTIEQAIRLINEKQQDVQEDLLQTAGVTQRLIKPLLDIAQESNPGHLNRFCCIQPSDLVTAKNVNAWINSHPLMNTEWTMVGPNAEELCEELPDHWEKRACKFDIYSGDSVPESAKGQCDTLLLDRVLHNSSDVTRLLQRISELLVDQGTAIVVENTAHFELTLLLDYLKCNGRLPSPGDSRRVHGMYLKHEDWLAVFEDAGFDCVALQTDKCLTTTAYLLHRRPNVQKHVSMVNVDDIQDFTWLADLQTISEEAQARSEQTVWLTSTQLTDNGCVGLGFCLREEAGAKWMPYRTISNVSLKQDTPSLDLDSDGVKAIVQGDIHSNCYRDGQWGSYRHFPANDEMESTHPFQMCEHAYITTVTRGDLSSLRWFKSSNEHFDEVSRPDNIKLVAVYYAPLNFRDIMIATGKLTPEAIPAMFGSFADRDSLLGTEFSGRRFDNGERLMGLLPGRALATSVVVHDSFVFPVPDQWTLEEASTVPVVYCTAYYALCVRGRLQRGERVLLHSGSGGVGQAAIAIALSYGCEVFTTCGSQEKRNFLTDRFPSLKNDHILNSRSTHFERQIQRLTRGKGVNVVLNSLSDDKLQASLRCLSEHGRFLEIGKFDMTKNSKMGLRLFLKSVTFHGILLDALTDADNTDWHQTSKLFTDGIRNGVVRPLPTTVFTGDQVENSFRYMASGNHIGKVLVQIRPEEREQCIPRSVFVRAISQTVCHPLHVYLITGGLGGFGLELAQWLVNRGATKIVLTSRSGIKTGYQARCVDVWKKAGVNVVIEKHEMTSAEDTSRLIDNCLQIGPMGGIFHLAMVLRDALLENQSVDNFKEAAESKYWGTRNLDKVTRAKCEDMKWFVVFSSITAGRGNTGQTAYGWSNSTMERIVEQRRSHGYSGIAIQWGAIGDVGVIIENMGNNSTVVSGTLPQRIPSCLQALDTFLSWNHPLVSSYVRADTGRKATGSGGDILSAIAHIIGVNDPSDLDMETNMGDLGIDSLMGVEIKQVLERDHDLVLNMKDIRKLNLRKLKALAEGDNSIREQLSDSQTDSDGTSKSSTDKDLEQQMNDLFKLRVDVNEVMSYEDVVQVNEVTHGVNLFFVHSIEGIAAPIKRLCSLVQCPAYCLQSTPNTPMNSIEECATHYIHVMRKIQPEGPYRICGYSYGACIAFAMACQLEQAAVPNQVVLLDGSHHYMQTYRKAYRLAYGVETTDLTNNALFETEILCALAARFGNFDYNQMRETLLKGSNWDARVDSVSADVMKAGLFTNKETFVWVCNAILQKFRAADKFEPSYKYQGNMSLVRAEQGAAKDTDVGHDYGLSSAVTGSVDVHIVDGDHDSMVQGSAASKTAEILNKLFNNLPLSIN